MILQGNVAPTIGHDIVLRGVEIIASGHPVPFTPQRFAVLVFYEVCVFEVVYIPVAAFHYGGLQRPERSVQGLHDKVIGAFAPVAIVVGNVYVYTLPPFGRVVDAEC